jgi:hypothetical protein
MLEGRGTRPSELRAYHKRLFHTLSVATESQGVGMTMDVGKVVVVGPKQSARML